MSSNHQYSGTENNTINELIMRTKAPAVFNRDPHDDCTKKYKVFSTWEAIQALAKKGWYPTDAMQVNARRRDPKMVKHLVRFRNDKLKIGDDFPELIITNAHDRTNAWHLDGGIFRFACANGLVVCDEEFGRIRIRHMGHEMNEIIESTEKFADHVCDLSNSLQTMKDTKLSKKERSDFALEALSIKYPKKEQLPFDSDLLLTTRRVEDEGHTLWNTLNVIQENLIKGGVPYQRSTGKHSIGTTRAVNSVSENLRINKAVWDIAHNMMVAA